MNRCTLKMLLRSIRRSLGYHTVRSGDTLSGIARKYGTSVKEICRLNGIKETTILQVGKRLRVR